MLKVIQDKATFDIVRNTANAYQPQITYPNGMTQTVTVKELRSLFPAVVYSQGELAEIGKQAGKRTQISDLLQFVNIDYKREDDQLASDIESAKGTVRSTINKVTANWQLQSRLRKLTTTRDSVRQRVEALERTLPTLSADDQAVVDYFDKANEFDSKRNQASNHADEILAELEASATELLSERDLSTELRDDVSDVQQRYRELFAVFDSGLRQLQGHLKTKRGELSAAELEWTTKFNKARIARDSVLLTRQPPVRSSSFVKRSLRSPIKSVTSRRS